MVPHFIHVFQGHQYLYCSVLHLYILGISTVQLMSSLQEAACCNFKVRLFLWPTSMFKVRQLQLTVLLCPD